MEILGIGPSELVFIIIIALIVLGPKDMQKAGRTIGRWLNQLIQSDGWKAFQQTSREIRNIPTTLMREANMEMRETEKEIRKAMDIRQTPNTSKPVILNTPNDPLTTTSGLSQPQENENSIEPPSAKPNPQSSTSDESSSNSNNQQSDSEENTASNNQTK